MSELKSQFEEALAARGVKRRAAVLRSIIRDLFIKGAAEGPYNLSEAGDSRTIYDVLRLMEQAKDDRKCIKACFFLLGLQLVSQGCREHLVLLPDEVLSNSVRQRVMNIPYESSSSTLLRRFYIQQVCTFLPIVGDREVAEARLKTILDEMSDQGYPVLKKTFFGKSRAVAALDDSISLWQSVFSAMRRMKYVPSTIEHFKLLFTALKSENIILQRHACALLCNLAGSSATDEALYDRVMAHVERSEAEGNSCGFPLSDHLCRSSTLNLLSRLTDNEQGVSIEQLAILYTRIYDHIENLDGSVHYRAKTLADRVNYFVESSRSWLLKVALSTRDNNVFSGTISLLSLQIEIMPTNDVLFPLILRAAARVGRFFVRKHTEYDSQVTDQKHLNNDIKDYYCITELCKSLNNKVPKSEIANHAYLGLPHVLTQALVSLAWLCPTDDRVSLTESRGVTDEFWISLQKKFTVSLPYLGLHGCISFIDNLFHRLEMSTRTRHHTGSAAVTWMELRPHHLNMYQALCNVTLEVVLQYFCPQTVQLLHNLWTWSDSVLRQTSVHALQAGPEVDTSAAKRAIESIFARNVSFVLSREFVAALDEEENPSHTALDDLRRYGVWLLAEHALLWAEGPDGNVEVLSALEVALSTISTTRSSLTLSGTPPGARDPLQALAKLASRLSSDADLRDDSRYHGFRVFLKSTVTTMLGADAQKGEWGGRVNPLVLASSRMAPLVSSTSLGHDTSAPEQLSQVQAFVDGTWVSQRDFKAAAEGARERGRETREQQEQHLKRLLDARERAATEYRTYKPEEHEEVVTRIDTHAHYLSVKREREKEAAFEGGSEGEALVPEEGASPEQPAVAPEKEEQLAGETRGADVEEQNVSLSRQEWVPLPQERKAIDQWFDCVEGSTLGRISAAALVTFLGASREYLNSRRIGLDQLRALWNIVDTAKAGTFDRGQFYVFMRLLMIACAGRKPSLEFYYETVSNRRIPLPLLNANISAPAPGVSAPTPAPVVWDPLPEVKQAISTWYGVLCAKAQASGNPNNRPIVATFLGTCGISIDVLKRIWALLGLNEASHVHGSVTEDKFTALVRLVSLAMRGIEPTLVNYRATSTDQSIPLATFNV